MKLLHIHTGNPKSNSAKLLTNFANAQQEDQHEFAVCNHTQLAEQLIETKGTIEILGDVKLSHPHKVWMARKRLRKLVGKGEFDAVICHGSKIYRFSSITSGFRSTCVQELVHTLCSCTHSIRYGTSDQD